MEQQLFRDLCAGQPQTPRQTANRQRLQGRLGRGDRHRSRLPASGHLQRGACGN